MDKRQIAVFVLTILFQHINLISGASLGNVDLVNETSDSGEEHKTVLQNIQKNYFEDEFRNYEMGDIEKYFNGLIPSAKKLKKPIHTSKTFFGSDQFSSPHEISKDKYQHQIHDSSKAHQVSGYQPLYFDDPDDLNTYFYSKNIRESIDSKSVDEKSSDFPPLDKDFWGDKLPLSKVTSSDQEKKHSEIKGDDYPESKVDESADPGDLNTYFYSKNIGESTDSKSVDEKSSDFLPLDKNFWGDELLSKVTSTDQKQKHSETNGDDYPESKVDESDELKIVIGSKEEKDVSTESTGGGNPTKASPFQNTDTDEFQGSGDMDDSFGEALKETGLDNKSGRLLEFFPRVNSTNECTTPKGEKGRCLSLTQCPLSDPLSNFNLFLQYVCLSRGVLVGICCPDNPVVETTDPTDNSSSANLTELKQPIDGCGGSTNTRIVGGKVSLPHEWTWMVALMRRNRFFCGGVIINDWYILTAAHCVMGIKVKDLKVRLGEYNFNEKNEHQQDISVSEIKRHALFVTLTFQHDIALLKLKRRIEYTKFIGSICLPDPKSGDFSNVNATVVGWGTVAFGGAASPVLRQVTIPVWDNAECDKTYRLERITEAFMCAGSPENGEDACQGDSGGPLMTMNDEGRWEVIGIVSWGRRCGDPTFPGVYTRVSTYLDWIAENAT